ncbi:hypothetical protein DFR28_10637 [Arenicella xantha]|uniref:Uncharacterized protein n=1 Tax=Arenicella xantha TaxID=644221 RepID=A0A395JIU6_9GAMM|nr:hypothetical protein DFR28_10637 [Arenicella xantha]
MVWRIIQGVSGCPAYVGKKFIGEFENQLKAAWAEKEKQNREMTIKYEKVHQT